MNLTIATESDLIINIQVCCLASAEKIVLGGCPQCAPQDRVAAVKEKVAGQIGIPTAEQQLLFQGRVLRDSETVLSAGIADGDLLMLEHQVQMQQSAQSDSSVFGQLTREQFMDQARNNPQLLAQLEATNRQLADAIRSNDSERVEAIVKQARERELARQQEIEQLMLNPMDIESQRRIEELIRQKNVEENFQQAIEHTPEMFGTVSMLYVHMEVNGVPVQAFVDTGAQMTIMTEEFAGKCSLMRLIDKRFAGMALGVGKSRILGRVHQAPLKVGEDYVTSSLTVIEQKSGPPFIFGLDNLIRHQCTVDLNAMKLFIGSINAEVPFLAEHQIQQWDERLHQQDSDAATSTANRPDAGDVGDVSEEKVERLVALGFDRQRCVEALKATGGNEDAAASILLGHD